MLQTQIHLFADFIESKSSRFHTVTALVDNVGTQKPTQQAGHDNLWKTSQQTVSKAEEGDGAGGTVTHTMQTTGTLCYMCQEQFTVL